MAEVGEVDLEDPEDAAGVVAVTHLETLLSMVESDLDAARAFVGRVVVARDALRAAASTVAFAALGLSIANDEPLVALLASPLVLILGLGEARQEMVLRNVTQEARQAERILDAHFKLLRDPDEDQASMTRRLRERLDAFEFGVERTLRKAKARQWISATLGRSVWYLFVLLIGMLVVAGLVGGSDESDSVCVKGSTGTVQLAELPSVESGSIAVVPCET